MRQFVFGLLIAVLAIYGWSKWQEAKAAGDEQERPGGAPPVEQALGDATGEAAALPSAPLTQVPLQAEPAEDVPASLVGADASAVSTAWRRLADHRLAIGLRQQWAAALGAMPADDADAALQRLGANNAFLHSKEGLAAAGVARTLLDNLPDADFLPRSTRLLELCMRGRIDKGDEPARQFVVDAYTRHRTTVDRWLCNPTNVARCRSHTIGDGEGLAAVAAKYRRKDKLMVEDGLLAVVNRIHNKNAVGAGQKIKVPVDPFVTVVEKRSFLMAVYLGESILRLYWIAHGLNDKTPVTEFTILEKVENPPWYAPDGSVIPFGHPKNVLGRFFVKFKHPQYTGYGAHGTTEPESIGTMASDGCIRLGDADIADYFAIVPRGTKFVIRATE